MHGRVSASLTLLVTQPVLLFALSLGHLPRGGLFGAETNTLITRDDDPKPCSPIVSLNPEKYNCKPSELAVNGSCQALNFGDSLDTCKDSCHPGQWCYKGKCENLQVTLNPLHCIGSNSPSKLAPGEVCVNGAAVPLNITGDHLHCGKGQQSKRCDPGHYCHEDSCKSITVGSETFVISTDPYHCGEGDKDACLPGSICLSGTCQNVVPSERHR